MSKYVDKVKLAAELRASQAAGRMSDELGRMVHLIARRYVYRWPKNTSFAEDAVQETVLLVLKNFKRLDPDQNIFSYVSTTLRNACLQRIQGEAIHKHKLYRYWKMNLHRLDDGDVAAR